MRNPQTHTYQTHTAPEPLPEPSPNFLFSQLAAQIPAVTPLRHQPRAHLDGGVVLVHEVVLDELDGQRALPDAASSHHHQLVFRHRPPSGPTRSAEPPAPAGPSPATPTDRSRTANAEHPSVKLPASGPGASSSLSAGSASATPGHVTAAAAS